MDFERRDLVRADKVGNILTLVGIQNVVIGLAVDVQRNPLLLVLNYGKAVIFGERRKFVTSKSTHAAPHTVNYQIWRNTIWLHLFAQPSIP